MRRRLSPIALLLSVVVLCGCDISPPTPEPNEGAAYLVRHRASNVAPLGMGGGVVELRGKCLYLGPDLLVWPESFVLADDDPPIVVGDGWTIVLGATITVGGGDYEQLGLLPSPIIGEPPPCPGPYIWVSEVLGVE